VFAPAVGVVRNAQPDADRVADGVDADLGHGPERVRRMAGGRAGRAEPGRHRPFVQRPDWSPRLGQRRTEPAANRRRVPVEQGLGLRRQAHRLEPAVVVAAQVGDRGDGRQSGADRGQHGEQCDPCGVRVGQAAND